MKCPKCGKDMSTSKSHVFCTHCGYLDNGEQIHGYEEHQVSDLEIYLGNAYDTIVRGNNTKTCFLLGPLYLWIRGFIIIGFLLQILEIYIWYLIVQFGENTILVFLGILITRAIAMISYNPLCVFLYRIKIKVIKKKYPTSYLEYLRKNTHNSISGLGIFLFIFLIVGILVCFWALYFMP